MPDTITDILADINTDTVPVMYVSELAPYSASFSDVATIGHPFLLHC